MAEKIVAMVPARAGSQGLKDKNIKLLAGKPLIAHSIEPAVACEGLAKTYINSDSDTYLKVGQEFGATPFKRDAEFGSSSATMQQVVANFVDQLEARGEMYDAVLVLYPTYPFRTADHLTRIIEFYRESPGCSSVIGLKSPRLHPYLCATLGENGSVSSYLDFDVNKYYRRQDYPECYEFTAWAMVASTKHVHQLNAQMRNDDTRGYVIPDSTKVVDIDTMQDFEFAEFLHQGLKADSQPD